MRVPTLIAALCLAATATATFTDSCTNCRFISNKAVAAYFACDCKTVSGSTTTSGIALSNCYSNNNGDLVAQANGGAFLSCSAGSLGPAAGGALFLGVACPRNDGSTHSYSINLNVGPLHNNNGQLQCF
ncbi:hypothetical protein B0T17DRAFT_612294 [Bombardia bombarda]|uniref:Cyanovirin-N domain-containing protein n=1 Tax=Bombardia bombarda TaxID=252184 RepID=A0AA39XLD2_9PEZI|nr:hypothetical protein B0T17DRAFT_612294 [Bombardia bombarda]